MAEDHRFKKQRISLFLQPVPAMVHDQEHGANTEGPDCTDELGAADVAELLDVCYVGFGIAY